MFQPPSPPGYTPVATTQDTSPPTYAAAGYDPEAAYPIDHKPLLKECEPNVRLGFVRKVYAILSMQLGFTTIVAAFCMYHAGVKAFVQSHPTILIASCFASILLIFPLMIYRKQEPLNRILLAAFTFVEAYIVGVVCASKDSETVLQATIITFGIFIGLTLYTLQSKLKFEGMQPFLFSSLLVLVQVMFLQAFFPFNQAVDVIFTLFGAVLFCGYIVYDTYMMFEKYNLDEYIRAAVELYLDILNLFLRILQLLSKKN
ncbi:UNVERIFIED_CONTAM: Transmembrane BAX inhibitor motif-containing protein 4 [Siphonaria sp. JEL0065]|nr:Transmembrane BAX inhibitor motif-containing protein 4 [Siphonaria sp. JEL0065]